MAVAMVGSTRRFWMRTGSSKSAAARAAARGAKMRKATGGPAASGPSAFCWRRATSFRGRRLHDCHNNKRRALELGPRRLRRARRLMRGRGVGTRGPSLTDERFAQVAAQGPSRHVLAPRQWEALRLGLRGGRRAGRDGRPGGQQGGGGLGRCLFTAAARTHLCTSGGARSIRWARH